jgi:hypothetical protein
MDLVEISPNNNPPVCKIETLRGHVSERTEEVLRNTGCNRSTSATSQALWRMRLTARQNRANLISWEIGQVNARVDAYGGQRYVGLCTQALLQMAIVMRSVVESVSVIHHLSAECFRGQLSAVRL